MTYTLVTSVIHEEKSWQCDPVDRSSNMWSSYRVFYLKHIISMYTFKALAKEQRLVADWREEAGNRPASVKHLRKILSAKLWFIVTRRAKRLSNGHGNYN